MRVALVRYYDQSREEVTCFPDSLNEAQGVFPPLGLAYIAAVLEKNGVEVRIIDCLGEGISTGEFRERLREFNPDLVGIGPVMTPSLDGVYECARICKELGFKTVLGGTHLALYPKETMTHSFVDYGMAGEADYAFLELVKAVERRKGFSKVPGLVYRKNGKVMINAPTLVMDLDSLPMPAYHLLPMKKYNCIIALKKTATVITSRGCPFNCGFCYKTPSDKKYRRRSPAKVVEEIEYLIKNYGIEEIMFYDDTLTVDRNFVLELCREIKKSRFKIKWESPTRVDCVDEELLRVMADAGCIRLRFGVESGNDRILEHMNKRITKERVREVFGWCRKIGIQTFAYFIIGYHGEDEETVRDTINFACELNPDHALFSIGTPLPGTKYWEDCVSDGVVDAEYWRNYTLGKKQGRFPYIVKDADKWVNRAYKKFYFRTGYVWGRVKKINSWDYIKKNVKGALAISKMK